MRQKQKQSGKQQSSSGTPSFGKAIPMTRRTHTFLIKFIGTLLIFVQVSICRGYCTGGLCDRDIVGIWRLRSKKSFLPSFVAPTQAQMRRPMKEFTVFPPKPNKVENTAPAPSNTNEDILLLLREDGNFVQYAGRDYSNTGNKNNKYDSKNENDDEHAQTNNVQNGLNEVAERTSPLETLQGSWALVEGKLILALEADQERILRIRSESSKHDTMMTGTVVAKAAKNLEGNPALAKHVNSDSEVNDVVVDADVDASVSKEKDGKDNRDQEKISTTRGEEQTDRNLIKSSQNDKEDVHLSVQGEISVGKFFYPPKHPSFFEQPMFGPTSTGSFELKQILGTLNTQMNNEDQPVEKFRKRDLENKRYFLTSYPLKVKSETRKRKQRWSIKYNKYVDAKPMSDAEKVREEMEKNEPMNVKSFEVELFSNNTFCTITGLGDTVLRGKWRIGGEERDQLWMSVWRFGFGRDVSGSTFSEGSYLSSLDDVSYWGKIYELDVAVEEDSIEDDPSAWKGTRIEINGAVMMGVGLEPCSIAQFTMIEKTEDDFDEDEDEIDELPFDVGSFE